MDTDSLRGLAARHGLRLIEDAACGLGAAWGATPCGAAGDAGCLSSHARKILTTGEGGAIATGDEEVADRCRCR
jgi:perosamine synthetase